jgi:putative nucleotidyltransferase with HDIG domain
MAQEQTIGVLWVGRNLPFSDEEVRLLTAISDMAANAIQRASLHEQTERRLKQAQALRTIDQAISSSLDLRLTLSVLLEQVTTNLNVDAASVSILIPNTGMLEIYSRRGFHTGALRPTTLRLRHSLAGKAVLENRILSIPNLAEVAEEFDPALLLAQEGFISYYAVPLVAKGQVKGVLEIFHRSHYDPDPEWLEFLESLATQAAIAMDNAELFQDLQRSNQELILAYDATLEGWVRALDMRDKETENHTQRVTEMTLRLARAIGMPEKEMVHIRRGALLHDIGKMGIPDSILHKPGKLTEQEWEIMRKHPVYAYNFLAPIAYLRPALDIPYCHHEKWDGSGYPRGLKGEQIPKAARIFAVVDVWDALSSDRPYRKAWPKKKVLQYLKEQSGLHFDPAVVKAFLELI